MRSSALDDYKNGVDHLIVDRLTGNVICSFDEVNDRAGGGRRIEEKLAEAKKKARKGGARVKYGVTFEGEEGKRKIVRKNLENIPSFYLALTQEELRELLAGMEFDISAAPSAIELKVFDALMAKLESQNLALLEKRIPDLIRKQLEDFKESIQRMKELGEQLKK